jgi:hypothetical protein
VARSRVRLPAALLALIWIGAPLGSVVHIAVDRHTWCPEHQAVEEMSPLEGTEAAGHATAEERAPEPNDHEDCATDELFSQTFTLGLDAPAVTAAPAALPSAAVASLVDAPAIPILSFAPKSSPPAIG